MESYFSVYPSSLSILFVCLYSSVYLTLTPKLHILTWPDSLFICVFSLHLSLFSSSSTFTKLLADIMVVQSEEYKDRCVFMWFHVYFLLLCLWEASVVTVALNRQAVNVKWIHEGKFWNYLYSCSSSTIGEFKRKCLKSHSGTAWSCVYFAASFALKWPFVCWQPRVKQIPQTGPLVLFQCFRSKTQIVLWTRNIQGSTGFLCFLSFFSFWGNESIMWHIHRKKLVISWNKCWTEQTLILWLWGR